MTVLITLFFFFNDTATTEIYTLSPHDALPISKVFVDGRSDFYGQDLLETYAQVVEVKPGWDAVLKQFDVRFVLVAPDNALASALQLSSEWKRVHTDPVAAVFERVS